MKVSFKLFEGSTDNQDSNPNPNPNPDPNPNPEPVNQNNDGIDWGSGIDPATQTKLNGILKNERIKQEEKHRKKTQELIDQLENMKKSASLTASEKDKLETQISDLSRSIMTKEQLAQEEQKKLKKQFDETAQNLTRERDEWKNRYTQSTIERSIIDEGVRSKAFVPEDLIALLGPSTSLTEEKTPDGQSTGRLVPRVSFKDVDAEGKQVTLDLSVPEAVKRMTELPRYGHLFETTAKSGLGMSGGNPNGPNNVDVSKLTVEEYAKHRKKILNTF